MQLTRAVDKTRYKMQLTTTVDKTPYKTQITLTVDTRKEVPELRGPAYLVCSSALEKK